MIDKFHFLPEVNHALILPHQVPSLSEVAPARSNNMYVSKYVM